MKISNRVKRNIAAGLMVIGLVCTIVRVWELIMAPESGKTWVNLGAIMLATYFCLDRFRILQRRIKQGCKYGPRPTP